jgi:hypothetical protein
MLTGYQAQRSPNMARRFFSDYSKRAQMAHSAGEKESKMVVVVRE